ncbi:DNA-directed RNA polymerase [Inquilinus limosus]|uniref:DNA-directed RNA polymerase n=1 Tax=Inquilinus limosus TaxID=171674 RepID=UPI000416AE03|nr:DNA-directed RNA polymerase [Inquilinus limosus]
MQDHPKWARQVELEAEMRSLGVERYQRALEDARKYGTESEVGAMRRLLGEKAPELIDLLKERFYVKREGRAGRGHAAARYLRMLEPETAALIALRGTLDRISRLPSYQVVCFTIGGMVEDECHFRHFQALEKARVKEARASKEKTYDRFIAAQEIALKNTPNQKRRRKQIKDAAKAAGVDWVDWDKRTTMLVGMALLETLIDATGLVEKIKEADSTITIAATEAVREWLKVENKRCEALAPCYLPTVIPPKPWDNPWSGGYWTNRVRSVRLIKRARREYLEELEGCDLSQVYGALNAAQNTAWAINASVYNVLTQMIEQAEEAGPDQPSWFPIPRVDKVPVPERLHDLEGIDPKDRTEEQQARIKARNHEARKVHKANAKSYGKLTALWLTMRAADIMLPEGRFYMPYNLDFRGRMYAIPTGLSPQGEDIGKALLRFADPLPIMDQTAADWLAIHGAGTFGQDKVPFAERIQWVKDHEAEILASAEDPFRCRFWAEKGDTKSKWQALAFCFEWAGFKRVGFGYQSTLAVAQDGTCNGIQNFSAMLLDEQGGAAVNMIPNERPSDIYQMVADKVNQQVEIDAFEGEGDDAYYARGWRGRVTRSVTKRPVMTLPYGSERFGFTDHILEDTVEPWKHAADQGQDAFPWEKTFGPAQYMGKLVWDAAQDVVPKAVEAMDWLRKVAQAASKGGLPVRWTTPCGLVVQQLYQKTNKQHVETTFGGARLQMWVQEPTGELDPRKQASTLPPNFVHSLDAAHMQRTVVAAERDGVRHFALIHDSYGTHAANSQRLADHLRAEFVRMYSEKCVLGAFKEEMEEQMGQPGALPPVPEKGNLNLQDVLHSPFFFA